MKKWFKRGLFALVVFVIVALVGAAVFLLTFDPNAYKNKVEQLVFDRYQRQLSIDGDIELSLFPRIGLAVEQVSLTDKQSDEPFAAVDHARFAVAVWPLLWNRLVVDHVAVSGLKMWLHRDAQGEFNFMDLLQRGPNEVAQHTSRSFFPTAQAQSTSMVPDASQAEFQIDIAGLELKNGEIHFTDEPSATQLRVVDLELNTGRMTFGQPFDVIFKGALQGESPITDATLEGQAVVQLEPHLYRYSAQRMNLALSGHLGAYEASAATLRGGVELLTHTKDIRVRNLELSTQGKWRSDTLALDKVNMTMSAAQLNAKHHLPFLTTQKLQWRLQGLLPVERGQSEHKVELALDVPKFVMEPEQVQGEPIGFSFKQTQGSQMFGVTARAKDYRGALAQLHVGQVHMDVAGKNAQQAYKLGVSSPAQWDQTEQRLVFPKLMVNTLLDNEALNPNPAQALFSGEVDWLFAQQQAHVVGEWQSANTQAQLQAQLQYGEQERLQLNVQAPQIDLNPWRAQAKPAPDAPAVKPVLAKMLPDYFDWRALATELTLQAEQLHYKNYILQGLQLQAEQKNREITIAKLSAQAWSGQLDMKANWSHQKQSGKMEAHLKQIDMMPFSQSIGAQMALSGTGDIKLALATHGKTRLARLANMTGSSQVHVKNGSAFGWDFWQYLQEANEAVRNVFSGQVQSPAIQLNPQLSTPFTVFSYDVKWQQGQGQITQLQWQSPGVNAQVERGYVDSVNQQMDMDWRFDVKRKTLPDVYQHLGAYSVHPIYARLSGSWLSPQLRLQWQELKHPEVQQAIDQGLLNLLDQPIQSEGAVPDTATKTLGTTIKDLLKK
ncbi:AsmA family protein [Paenalcaligenes hermetiae]|uniref:AsmA family protein n=1 Tax=Paenalcaligenes hermetiae TaxID=1157987 RepID=A0ABP9LQU1_9BURK